MYVCDCTNETAGYELVSRNMYRKSESRRDQLRLEPCLSVVWRTLYAHIHSGAGLS